MNFEHHLKIKIFSYYAVLMEENEEDEYFFYICAKYARGLSDFYRLKQSHREQMQISEICVYLHTRCMKNYNGGEYSINYRYCGNHYPPSPDYIEIYMRLLDEHYRRIKDEDDELNLLPTRIYYIFEYIHPFGDGNGRVGKALHAILRDNLSCKVKSFKQHKMLCEQLEILQCKEGQRVFEDRKSHIPALNNLKYILE